MPNDLTPDDLMPEYATPTFRMTPHMLEVANEYGADFLGVEAYLDHRETTLVEFARKKGMALDAPWPTNLAPATGSPDDMQPEIALALRLIPTIATLPHCPTLEIGIELTANPYDPTEWGEEPDGTEAARYMSMHLYGEPMGMPNGFGDDIHDDAATELHLLVHRIICTCVNCGHRPAMIGVATEAIAAQLRGLLGNLEAKIVVDATVGYEKI